MLEAGHTSMNIGSHRYKVLQFCVHGPTVIHHNVVFSPTVDMGGTERWNMTLAY